MAALALLLVRHWSRASLPDRLRRDRGRRASAAAFRLGYFVMMSAWGYTVGHLVTKLEPAARLRGAGFIVVGLVGLSVVWSALTRGPSLRGDPSVLESAFLETLPIRASTRLVVGLLERLFVHAFGASALIAVAPESPGRAALLAVFLATSGILAGEALMRVARVLFAPMTIARTRSYLLVLGQVAFLMCVVQAPALGKSERLAPLVAGWPAHVARALAGQGAGIVLAACAACAGLAFAAIEIAERIGWDRVELVPTGKLRQAAAGSLVLERIDEVLRAREPGGRWSTWVMAGYSLLVTLAIVGFAWNVRHPASDTPSTMTRGVIGLAGFGAFVVVTARGARMALRDVTARPLLAPLPLTPRDLLAGKVQRLRIDALIVAAPVALLFATPWPRALHLEIVWRLATLLVAVVFSADAAASIAFLTVGAGSRRGPGGGFAVESVLVLAPLVGITTAPHLLGAVVPLVALVLVAREARRSALRCVRWLDDPDDFDRETPIWRALLVLAAYQAMAAVTVRIAIASELSRATTALLRDLLSAVVLAGLVLGARREAPPMQVATRLGGWLLGLSVGLLTGLAVVGHAWLRHRLGVFVFAPQALTAIVVLPIVEEAFFRGWLQPCVEDELGSMLPAAGARVAAVIVTAFAFAAAAPLDEFLPRIALGLGAGGVFSRSRAIGPSVAVHVVHTVLVVLFAAE